MPIGFGKHEHKSEEFLPTNGELEFLGQFLVNRDVPFLEVKKLILEKEEIKEDRREKLGEWFRDARAKTPSTSERIQF
jgi:hypothetical protein